MLIELNTVTKLTMMKISQEIKNFALVFFILDLCLSIYALVYQSQYWLLNMQVAFFSSLIITVASFLSYKRNVQNRISTFDLSKEVKGEDRDKIDEIDDPYDLYTEYDEIPEEELTPEKIKEIINDEKSKVKKNSFKNTVFSAGGFVSIYRVIGYGALILGFFALNNNKIFLPIAFLIGLGIVPIGVLLSKLLDNKR